MTDKSSLFNIDPDMVNEVAHDLKSPITSVKGFLELMRYAGELNERQTQYLLRAQGGLDKMLNYINDFLDMTRIDSGRDTVRVAECSLGVVAADAVELLGGLAEQGGVTVHLDIPSDLPPAAADDRLLTRVIGNLVGNSIKYHRESGNVWISATAIGSLIELVVRDDGYGIDSEDVLHVFEPFYRGKSRDKRNHPDGSGLGLAIVYAIVTRHNGEIRVDSVLEEGTTFTITLPQFQPSA